MVGDNEIKYSWIKRCIRIRIIIRNIYISALSTVLKIYKSFSIFMPETIARVQKLSSIIEKKKLSSENYLNIIEIINYLQIYYNKSRKLQIQDKFGTIAKKFS